MTNKDIAKYTALVLLYVFITFFVTPLLVSAPSTLLSIFGVLLLLVTHIVYITWAHRTFFASPDGPYSRVAFELTTYGKRFTREQLESIIVRCNRILNDYHPKDPK